MTSTLLGEVYLHVPTVSCAYSMTLESTNSESNNRTGEPNTQKYFELIPNEDDSNIKTRINCYNSPMMLAKGPCSHFIAGEIKNQGC